MRTALIAGIILASSTLANAQYCCNIPQYVGPDGPSYIPRYDTVTPQFNGQNGYGINGTLPLPPQSDPFIDEFFNW